MNMRAILLIFTLTLSIGLYGQDSTRAVREIGVNFSGLTNGEGFGIRFKQGKKNTFLRITLLSIFQDLTKRNDSTAAERSIGVSFGVGFEKRKRIDDRFTLYYGLDLRQSYGSYNSDNSNYNY